MVVVCSVVIWAFAVVVVMEGIIMHNIASRKHTILLLGIIQSVMEGMMDGCRWWRVLKAAGPDPIDMMNLGYSAMMYTVKD